MLAERTGAHRYGSISELGQREMLPLRTVHHVLIYVGYTILMRGMTERTCSSNKGPNCSFLSVIDTNYPYCEMEQYNVIYLERVVSISPFSNRTIMPVCFSFREAPFEVPILYYCIGYLTRCQIERLFWLNYSLQKAFKKGLRTIIKCLLPIRMKI